MNVKTEIANLAIRHLGESSEISDLETDPSEAGKTLKSLFNYWMKTVLCGFNWNFATVITNIQPIICYPNQEWLYAYRYPADCLFLRRFWNGTHFDDRETVINFGFTNDAQGRQILTNWGPGSALASAQSNMVQPIPNPPLPTTNFTIAASDIVPCIEYTQDYESIAFWPPEFIWAFSLMLAGWAAPSFPKVGVIDLRDKNLTLGAQMMKEAMTHDLMEAKPPIRLVGELTKSRNSIRISMTKAGWAMVPESFTP